MYHHRFALWLLIVITSALTHSDTLHAQCSGCVPVKQHDVSGTITYKFLPSVPGSLHDDFDRLAGDWNSAFQAAGSNVKLQYSANGLIDIMIDDSICPDWGEGKNTNAGHFIRICPETLNYGPAFLDNTISHEFGHVLGFATNNCPKSESVMTEVQPSEITGAATSPGCADRNGVTQYYAPPPPRRDNDADEHSPDDPPYTAGWDCQDDDAERYWGYVTSCNYGMWQDRNCNDQDDWEENGCYSPIIVDVAGNGVRLTNAAGGVMFDLAATGQSQLIAWTHAGSDDAWLVLDRDKSGRIENGQELFGSFSPQPLPASGRLLNGFNALSVFDKPESGGNGDGWISASDAIYGELRLWQDANHDGISQPTELFTLASKKLVGISLEYVESQRRDQWGNLFLYRARVEGLNPPWVYDVYLGMVKGNMSRVPLKAGR